MYEAQGTDALGPCRGRRPWLGGGFASEGCNQLNKLLVRTGSNRAGGALDIQISVKLAEFRVLASGQAEMGADRSDSLFHAETLMPTPWGRGEAGPAGLAAVVAVDRLREVTAQVGFTRISPPATETDGELDPEVQRAALDIDQDWLPAFENRGEGVFVQLDAAAVQAWQARPAVVARARQLEAGFNAWKIAMGDTKRIFPGATYILVHSFAHLLLTAIAEECGYPASAVRERVYALPPDCFGVLLYTSTPGADGTLGGLAAKCVADGSPDYPGHSACRIMLERPRLRDA